MVAEVTDSSDWIGTPVACLADVDSALRCQICKEFLETPVITSCAHTFCSLCIRRCLANDGKCPLCRSPDQPNKLKNNNAMEEVVRAFKKARPEILQLGQGVRDAAKVVASTARKRKADEAAAPERNSASPRKTRSSARPSAAPQYTVPTIELADSDDDDDYVEEVQEVPAEPEKEDGLVPCPICGKRMAEEAVFLHLDNHQGGQPSAPNVQPSKASFSGFATSSASSVRKLEPLPGLNYSILNEAALRKKVTTMGIPANGNKAQLARRHGEWLNVWNANCDSRFPKSKQELLRDLDNWERTQYKAPAAGAEIMEKDFDGKAWATNHSGDFASLIARAREKRKAPSGAEEANNGTSEQAAPKPAVQEPVAEGPAAQNPALQEPQDEIMDDRNGSSEQPTATDAEMMTPGHETNG